jgi:hypothetical protein
MAKCNRALCPECEDWWHCGTFSAERGPNTIDGKHTFVFRCRAGLVGGCGGPTATQIAEHNVAEGKRNGASVQKPLWIERISGLPITHSSRQPVIVDRYAKSLPSPVTFKRR